MERTAVFSVMDYVVFIGTLLISMLIGLFYGCIKKQKTNTDLLVGGRNMAILPIALSLLATYMSSILVLGFAGEIYSHGAIIAEMIVNCMFFVPFGGLLFLPTLYELRLTSAYEYLELRFESPVVRMIATATFIVQIILYMGVVTYAPALALNAILNFPIWASILLIGGCAGFYTSIGGLRAVVWTDVFQILMMFAGILAIVFQGAINVGGFGKVFEIAKENGRLNFLNFQVDPFLRHTSFHLFFGQGTMWLSAYGCHQTTVQRYCSMSSLKRAFMALLLTGPLLGFTIFIASLAGIVIFANFAGCDPLTLGKITKSDQIAPYFVLEYLSSSPGLVGLFISCLMAGSLSTISSLLNSLTAVTWEDFFYKIDFFKNLSENKQGVVSKLIGVGYGGVAILMGFVAGNLGGVLPAAIVVNGIVAGPLLGVFCSGILIPFVNKKGATCGMLLAHAIVLWIGIGGLFCADKPIPLELRIDECTENERNIYLNSTLSKNMTVEKILEENYSCWPNKKMYTISYLLYPLIGTIVTVIASAIISLFTGPRKFTKDLEPYIHPLIVKINRKINGTDPKENIEMKSNNNNQAKRVYNVNHNNNEKGLSKSKNFKESSYTNSGFQE